MPLLQHTSSRPDRVLALESEVAAQQHPWILNTNGEQPTASVEESQAAIDDTEDELRAEGKDAEADALEAEAEELKNEKKKVNSDRQLFCRRFERCEQLVEDCLVVGNALLQDFERHGSVVQVCVDISKQYGDLSHQTSHHHSCRARVSKAERD